MYPLGEIEQRPRSWSASAENERTLRRDCPLDRHVILGDHRGYCQTKRPLDLSLAVMQPSAVPVDDDGESIWVDSERALQERKAGTCVPDPYCVGRPDEQNKVRRQQGRSMGSRLTTQQLGPDIQNDVAVPASQLLDQSLKKACGDPEAQIQLWDTAEYSRLTTPAAKGLCLLLNGM